MNIPYFWVGLGGAIGAMARVFLTNFFPKSVLGIPLKILLINVIGCFIAGVIIELMAFWMQTSLNTRHFLIQGLLGGFTTFSAFAVEATLFFDRGAYVLGIVYALLSVVLGIGFLFFGLRITRIFL